MAPGREGDAMMSERIYPKGVERARKRRGNIWRENAGWINLSCQNNAACAANPYGVANDGYGGLSGFAWGENIGWVNFAPTTCQPDPTCGVRIDPATGYFQGRAWGENVGW